MIITVFCCLKRRLKKWIIKYKNMAQLKHERNIQENNEIDLC